MNWEALNLTWHYLEKWARLKPERTIVKFNEELLRYTDLKEQMDQAAKAFLEVGVNRGDRVALLSMPRFEFPIVYMATNKIGAIWMGLSPKSTLEELSYMIGHAEPTVLIALRTYLNTDLEKTLTALKREHSCIKKLLVIGDPVEDSENFATFISRPRPELDAGLNTRAAMGRPEDEALLLYTSGSTGRPKGVLHTHRSILANIHVQVKKFHTTADTKGLLHFPINHVASATENIIAGLITGASGVYVDKFDPAQTLEIMEKERINSLGQVPVMFLMEFKDPTFFERDFSQVTHFVWSGAAAPKIMIDVLSNISKKTGAMMFTGYGSTEVCGFVTYTRKDDDDKTLMETAGRIAEGWELKIVDRNRKELPDGEVGEIAVRGPFLMKGYYKDPEATAEVIDNQGWYYTSDLAFKDERGYIHLAGRSSEMYKSGGENVFPREVEDVLESHDGVLFAAVIGVPDELYQEVGWAFIMQMPDKTCREEELRELCRKGLTNFKIPKRIFIRPTLPLLANGKVNKMALRQEIEL